MPGYLAELDHAEHEVLSRFHDYIDSFSELLGAFGINSRHAWYLVELPMEQLVPGKRGEVDILTGNLEPDDPKQFDQILNDYRGRTPQGHPQHHLNYAAMALALNGGLKWPPSLDYLVGIEVKLSYLPLTASHISVDEMKSIKTSKQDIRKLRRSVEKLLNLGFNKVGLFELLATPPADGVGSRPWNIASHIAGQTLEVMNEAFAKRLPENSPVGHGAVSISGINGREEFASGSLSFDLIRQPQDNGLRTDSAVKANRNSLEKNLLEILGSLPRPWGMPAVFIYDKKSKTISYANEGWIRC